jgi:beta-lactamase class A
MKLLIISGVSASVLIFLLSSVYFSDNLTRVEAAPNLLRTNPITNAEVLSDSSFDSKYAPSLATELSLVLNSFDYSSKNLAVSVTSLDTKNTVNVNGDSQFRAASLYKTLAAYRVLQLIDGGQLSLDQRISHKGVPKNTTLYECIEKAITVSDNPCGAALQKMSLPEELDSLVADWGLTNTTTSGVYPKTTSSDQVLLYSDIYEGKRLSTKSHKLLLSFLLNLYVIFCIYS